MWPGNKEGGKAYIQLQDMVDHKRYQRSLLAEGGIWNEWFFSIGEDGKGSFPTDGSADRSRKGMFEE